MKNPDLEIKLTLKHCPLCGKMMKGNSSQEYTWGIRKNKFTPIVKNKNEVSCPNCGYTEQDIKEFPRTAIIAYNKIVDAVR